MLHSTDPCDDCYTEQVGPGSGSMAPFQGVLGDNVVGFIDNIDDEQYCSWRCQKDALCEVYTYYRSNSTLFPSTCYLLSGFKEPIRDLDLVISC